MSGTFAPAPGSAACTSCPPGTSSEESDDGACLACPKGKFSAKSDSCEACPPGSFANGAGNAVCSPCPPNQYPKDDQTGCEVVTGYYNDGEGQSVAVPAGVKRNVPGMTLNTLDLEEGYWRTTLNSTEILQCVNKKHCLGGANITDMCADGYTGPLCAVCESGYAAMGSGELLTCEQCTGTSILKIFAWLIFVLVIFAAALFVSFRTLLSEDSQRSVRSRSASFGKVYEKVTKYMPVVKIILVNLDGEMLQDKVYFDVFLTVLQFLPMLVALIMNRDEVVEEVKNDIKEGKEGLGRAFSGDGGELVQNPMQDGKQVVLGGGSLGDVEMGGVGKMASIALSDNKETERQSSKPAPTVRGSKVAKSDLRDSMIPPAPKVEGGGQKDGREEKDKL
ncbi:hypothetical protein TrVE_jg7409 [Triparma verrucosa]|uniref:Tyrosine-protein kinase ephrin type A/B receptor-like domain-containing protein n=1 Tax=Triparma verrucosa TaxID=1606542 RepID=A0A9W7KSC9_9STRA|nr:hypothetical protein TrVE_jg7409 [Triparma verrucosa]